ncbi:hypothetical protein HBA55_16205 [Pseudomaricurvus alkylphenolicus]|uniref:PD-(D/E)XK nuclease family protein n=1 Tax=Pseudomaricurvus alkylphenolicus TaxID=1306991 RepID=UPI001422BBAD|nr:PD-(D/E)XK nuclease family protein [Pseudomaricurvus alkylphenolicus]NIB41147.1 hypothetical protein [Pseudomaricurvus alkylphenolicus]
MSARLFDIKPLLPDIQAGYLILTPNSRLRNKLQEAYNHHCQLQQLTTWPGARVHPLSEWIRENYLILLDQAAVEQPRVLASEFQQRQLWLDIIRADSEGAELINPLRLATDAQSAYRSLLRWSLTIGDVQRQYGENEDLPLLRWATEFENKLDELGLQTFEHMQREVLKACRQGLVPGEQALTLVGFDDLPPLTRTTLDAISLRQRRCDALSRRDPQLFQQPLQQPHCFRVRTDNDEDEIRQAARWAHQLIESDPTSTVAIISPNLGQVRNQVQQIFIEEFEPHYALPETPRYTLPFNFSAGIPLGSTPLISDALNLLRLNLSSRPLEDLVHLMNSPFWGAGTDVAHCARVSQRLRSRLRPNLRVSTLRQICHQLAGGEASGELNYPHWLDRTLQDFESLKRRHSGQRPPSQWADFFLEQLNLLNWPGERRLDSNEYQQVTRWYELLEEFCRLDLTGTKLSLSEALDCLGQLAAGEHFQAQTPDSPIQILGILEGSGLVFSHCWVLGMNQRDWPPVPQPNPLLPLELQRAHGMPHADAERELNYAETLTRGYENSADEVIFSYAASEGDTPLHHSALIAHLPEKHPHFEAHSEHWQEYLKSCARSGQWQWVNCLNAPPVSKDELEQIKGGSQIFRNQAISPLAAFCIHRLGASLPLEPSLGLSAIDRGQILHNALADLWEKLKHQKALLELAQTELQSLVDTCLDRHLQAYRLKQPDQLGERYLQLEKRRQQQLILQWLELEKQRPAFTVQSYEESIQTEFAGLPLRLRLDRLDRLDSGELILIDYKTGNPSPRSWGSDRPEEPQLPLYSLCYKADVEAVVFAQINAREVAIKGLGELPGEHDGIIPTARGGELDLPENWPDILNHWRTTLGQLGEDFLQGNADPGFKSPQLQRFYEALSPIFRWQEQEPLKQAFKQGADHAAS